MCDDITTMQLTEIQHLQHWLCEWYNQCGYFGGSGFSG